MSQQDLKEPWCSKVILPLHPLQPLTEFRAVWRLLYVINTGSISCLPYALVLLEGITNLGICKPGYSCVCTLHSAQVSSSSERIRRYPVDTVWLLLIKQASHVERFWKHWFPLSSSFLCICVSVYPQISREEWKYDINGWTFFVCINSEKLINCKGTQIWYKHK